MHVEAAVGRKVQERLRQDLPEGDDHAEVRFDLFQFRHRFGAADPIRLEDRDPVRLGADLYRRRHERLAASGGLVRLRDCEHDLMAGGDKSVQHRHGKFRGTHE